MALKDMYSQSNKILDRDPNLLLSHLLELRFLTYDQTVSDADYNDNNFDDVKKLKLLNLEVQRLLLVNLRVTDLKNASYFILYSRLPVLDLSNI